IYNRFGYLLEMSEAWRNTCHCGLKLPKAGFARIKVARVPRVTRNTARPWLRAARINAAQCRGLPGHSQNRCQADSVIAPEPVIGHASLKIRTEHDGAIEQLRTRQRWCSLHRCRQPPSMKKRRQRDASGK